MTQTISHLQGESIRVQCEPGDDVFTHHGTLVCRADECQLRRGDGTTELEFRPDEVLEVKNGTEPPIIVLNRGTSPDWRRTVKDGRPNP